MSATSTAASAEAAVPATPSPGASIQTVSLTQDAQGRATVQELFVYTSLVCNKTCRHCFVSSSPTNRTLDEMTLTDLQPLLTEARDFGVRDIYFTGGEPFLNRSIIELLANAQEVAPLTVYTNGTEPLAKRLAELREVNELHMAKHGRPILLRVSLDHYDADIHDIYYGRGPGAFARALEVSKQAQDFGLEIAITTQEDLHNRAPARQVQQILGRLLADSGITATDIKVLPDIPAGANSERLGAIDRSPVSPAEFRMAQVQPGSLMCGSGRTLIKIAGSVRVFPCTLLIPDSPDAVAATEKYELGRTLAESVTRAQALDHPACRAYCVRGRMSCAN